MSLLSLPSTIGTGSSLSQKYAVSFAFNEGEDWNLEDSLFFKDSGWYDYILSLGNTDMFPQDLVKIPVVIGGKMYIKFTDNYRSIYRAKFFSIPDPPQGGSMASPMVPVTLTPSKRELGYDYLLPADTTMEHIITFMHRQIKGKWITDFFSVEDIKRVIHVARYGIDFNMVVVTNQGDLPKLCALPGAVHRHPHEIATRLADEIYRYSNPSALPAPMTLGSASRNLDHHRLVYVTEPWTLAGHALKLPQYHLPDPSPDNLKLLEHDFSNSFEIYNFEGELAMSLASKDLIRQVSRTPTGYFSEQELIKCFAKNILVMGYLRYPLMLMTRISSQHSEINKITYKNYQTEYSKIDDKSEHLAGEYMPTEGQSVRFTVERRPENSFRGRPSRLQPLLDQRRKVVAARALGLKVSDIEQVYPVGDKVSVWISGKPRIFKTAEHEWTKTVAKMYYERDKLAVPHLFHTLEPLAPSTNTVTSIHGVLFDSFDLIRIFHNTPIASAVSLGAPEFDPPWLSYKDARLTRDLLMGRIMPLVFVNGLSDEAFEIMSGRDTFIYLYSTGLSGYQIDKSFILGMPMIEYLSALKSSDDLLPATRTFLSLIA